MEIEDGRNLRMIHEEAEKVVMGVIDEEVLEVVHRMEKEVEAKELELKRVSGLRAPPTPLNRPSLIAFRSSYIYESSVTTRSRDYRTIAPKVARVSSSSYFHSSIDPRENSSSSGSYSSKHTTYLRPTPAHPSSASTAQKETLRKPADVDDFGHSLYHPAILTFPNMNDRCPFLPVRERDTGHGQQCVESCIADDGVLRDGDESTQ
ncbi:hypothetical protein F5880DRAFT_1628349 [Lentinula raphanica]|nr:hypothetical protein F5880DRAFT_1628349 [Lentinula raphanica]